MGESVRYRLIQGDCLDILPSLPAGSVNCCVTSPPFYGLRDYGCDGQIGLESAPDEYVSRLVAVFAEVRRVLSDDGTLWLNLGDSFAGGKTGRADTGPADLARRAALYHTGTGEATGPREFKQRSVPDGLKPKDLIGIPWMVAFALRADGWYLRRDIIWSKPNPMPESVTDRPTSAHEYLFLLAKSPTYHYDADAIKERCTAPAKRCGPNSRADNDRDPSHGTKKQDAIGKNTYTGFNDRWRERPVESRNRRSVWEIATSPFPEAHFATFPEDLVKPCIRAGCPIGGVVLDPFSGAGTTGLVAVKEGRRYIGIELNPEYLAMSDRRIGKAAAQELLPLFEDAA